MITTYAEVCRRIEDGQWLHIAASEALLKKLPRGNWIGGSTAYFMGESGGLVSEEFVFVDELPYTGCKIAEYDANNISQITKDAFDNGFTIVILPFDSAAHISYAKNAAHFDGMFLKNIVGWVSGTNLDVPGQTPIAVNGLTATCHSARAVAMHIPLPADKMVNVGLVNIFEPTPDGPVVEFAEEGFTVTRCTIDGQSVVLADYLEQNNINTQLPLIGDYSGAGVNVSVKKTEGGVVSLYAPVFSGIKYRFARALPDYAEAFRENLAEHQGRSFLFCCNCILNFLYGGLEGKRIGEFYGPITFGEVAYQLVNQTLVYLEVL